MRLEGRCERRAQEAWYVAMGMSSYLSSEEPEHSGLKTMHTDNSSRCSVLKADKEIAQEKHDRSQIVLNQWEQFNNK